MSSVCSEVKAKPKQESLWPTQADLREYPGSHHAQVNGFGCSRLVGRDWGWGVLI